MLVDFFGRLLFVIVFVLVVLDHRQAKLSPVTKNLTRLVLKIFLHLFFVSLRQSLHIGKLIMGLADHELGSTFLIFYRRELSRCFQ